MNAPTSPGAGRARSWPDADVVGAAVSDPVTVYGAVERDARGELAHEGNRVPDIAALDARRLVVGWRAGVRDSRDPTPNDQGSILYARSEDGGATWTTGTLAAATATHRYHYVIFLNDAGTLYALIGRVAVSADRDAAGQVDGFPTTMVVKSSADGGRTWADFPVTVDVPANRRGVVVAGKPLWHDGVWLIPYWRELDGATRAGVLRSADLRRWVSGGLAANPPGIGVEEPQVVVAQDDPGTLLMVTRTLDLTGGSSAAQRDAHYRANAVYAATATSRDGGLTWSPLTLDRDLPNYYVKPFFARDAEGRYLTIYNTLAGPFTGPGDSKPDQYREVLCYKVRRPGAPWGPGRLFADGPRLTRGAARGWDVYASADEYEPGRFHVVWEHNQTNIKVARVDLSTVFTGVGPGWDGLAGWTPSPGGGTVELDARGHLRLANAGPASAGPAPAVVPAGPATDAARAPVPPTDALSTAEAPGFSGVVHRYGPSGGFMATMRARVEAHSRLDPATGAGAGLALKVATGMRRLMLAVQPDGVHSFVQGAAGWSRVDATPVGTASSHLWQVVVDAQGRAALYRDGAETGARWTVAASREAPQVAVWASGTAAAPARALVELVQVADDVASSTWDTLGGWSLDAAGGAAEVSGGLLRLRSTRGQVSKASIGLDVTTGCDFTLEFRGRVVDDSALDPGTGAGVSLGTKIANGQVRLMLTVQRGGVWTMRKGSAVWERVYSSPTAGAAATWKVTVDSAGVARLHRDGADTGATWVVQNSRENPQAMHWVTGTPGGNAAEARIEWTRITATSPGLAPASPADA
ncbi:sialidase family protein [Sphaerisporangium sp. TRM90804]|uniref:sialidase family protein n=1 Tax=Sphaerisporangium sp. TRM90804 TaxID=3031113 RepID=UPI002446A273|nr:sialidase family protein [Sphaerisporangium sp. TRM90804]MDH2429143.1 sialidase family protein [Sphaerisporangium sp. TRM90804]